MPTLLESLTSLATPAVGQIATRLGESETSVSRGVNVGLASVLAGIIGKAKDPSSIRQLFELFVSHPASANLGADVTSTVATLAPGAPAAGPASTLLSMLFGAKTNAVGEMITKTAGFKNASSGTSLLSVAAPLVLGYFSKSVHDKGLNVGGLSTMLAGERESILAAAPAGLASLVGTAGMMPRIEPVETLRGTMAMGTQTIGARPKSAGGNRWFWPIVGAAAVAVLAWLAFTRKPAPTTPPAITTTTAALDTAAMQAGQAVTSAAGEVAEGLGAFVKRMLPGGVTLNIPERGIESKLIAFIEDRSRPVNDTTWFDFDRLNFASGSATILPQSQEQLDNIVAVLRAYPNVNVKVGGYTDNVGGAEANMRLSQRRADAVMRALVSAGIPASRLQAEGYGEQHPVADNSTEQGRERNRRIALKVTKK